MFSVKINTHQLILNIRTLGRFVSSLFLSKKNDKLYLEAFGNGNSYYCSIEYNIDEIHGDDDVVSIFIDNSIFKSLSHVSLPYTILYDDENLVYTYSDVTLTHKTQETDNYKSRKDIEARFEEKEHADIIIKYDDFMEIIQSLISINSLIAFRFSNERLILESANDIAKMVKSFYISGGISRSDVFDMSEVYEYLRMFKSEYIRIRKYDAPLIRFYLEGEDNNFLLYLSAVV